MLQNFDWAKNYIANVKCVLRVYTLKYLIYDEIGRVLLKQSDCFPSFFSFLRFLCLALKTQADRGGTHSKTLNICLLVFYNKNNSKQIALNTKQDTNNENMNFQLFNDKCSYGLIVFYANFSFTAQCTLLITELLLYNYCNNL